MSITITPFVCKWSDAHSKPLFFNTQKNLELHVCNDHVYNIHEDLTKLEAFRRGRQIYLCPWEGCVKQLINIAKLKDHLCEHTKQRPFKCPICNGSRRFRFYDKLQKHLISHHNDSFVDSTGADDMTKQGKDNQDDTSDDEDYTSLLGIPKESPKSDDELIWEAHCKFHDPELIAKVIAGFKNLDEDDEDDI